MLGLAVLAAGIQMIEKFEEYEIRERISNAKTASEAKAIVQSTERFAFEIADEIFKEDLPQEGIEAKKHFILSLISANYDYFGFENPIVEGITFEDIQFRNGVYK